MIVLDTSVSIDALTGTRHALPKLEMALDRGHRLRLPSLVLFEWWRGPRTSGELAIQGALFPSEQAIAFGFGRERWSVLPLISAQCSAKA